MSLLYFFSIFFQIEKNPNKEKDLKVNPTVFIFFKSNFYFLFFSLNFTKLLLFFF